jgi:hypothetical protein
LHPGKETTGSSSIHHFLFIMSCAASTTSNSESDNALMVNPYAVKKAPPELFLKPLEEFDNFEAGSDNQNNGNAKDTSRNSNENDDDREEGKDTEAASTDHQQQQQDAGDDNNLMAMSVPLPLWKRLPSNTISYESAEILTVSEVCRHGFLYSKRSIRTTGVLLHRHRHEETGEISLALQDPLCKLTTESTSASSSSSSISTVKKTKGRRISFGSTNSNSASTVTKTAMTRRPSLGMAKTRTTPLPGGRGTPKTPLSSTSNTTSTIVPPQTTATPARTTTGILQRTTTGSSMMSASKFRTPALSSRKRPLNSSTTTSVITKTPPQNLQDCLVNSFLAAAEEEESNNTNGAGTSIVWIVADPNHVPVDTLSIGDLVTVIGTLQVYTPEQTNGASAAVCQLGNQILDQQQQQQQQQQNTQNQGEQDDPDDLPASDTTNTSSNKKKKILYLEARILRQDNGTNLRLHYEALKLRRKHILQRYFANDMMEKQHHDDETAMAIDHETDTGKNPTSSSASSDCTTTKLLPGCGPPPYQA